MRHLCPLVILSAVGLSTSIASAQVFQGGSWSNVDSYKVFGAPANTGVSIASLPGVVRRINISGQLQRVTAGTYPREAAVRVRRYLQVGLSLTVTHDFVVMPFTQTSFDSDGTATIAPGFFTIPVPASVPVGPGQNQPEAVLQGVSGGTDFWAFDLFEQFDDQSSDTSATPDARWSSLNISLDTTPVDYSTPPLGQGAFGSLITYNLRADGNPIGTTFADMGTTLNITRPDADRIRWVRLSGIATTREFTSSSYSATSLPLTDVRIRLTREEALFENIGSTPFTTLNEERRVLTLPDFAAPLTSSSRFMIELPISPTELFGNLGFTLPQTPGRDFQARSLRYYAQAYEERDGPFAADNVFNALKIELFESGQQPATNRYPESPVQVTPVAGTSENTLTIAVPLNPGNASWVVFDLATEVSASASTWLDIDAEGTASPFDAICAVYNTSGTRLAIDDDDGVGTLPALSFGAATPRTSFGGDYAPRDGRDGILFPGRYYLALVPYVNGLGTAALGQFDFFARNADTAARSLSVNLRASAPTVIQPCGFSDIAGDNQSTTPDGQLSADDIIVFLNRYFTNDLLADIAGDNQSTTPDGQLSADDIIVFLSRYFAGC